MKKLKIGLVIDDSLDRPDGVQQYVTGLGTWLTAQGHEVHYLAGETHNTSLQNVHSLTRNVAVSFNSNRLAIPRPASKVHISSLLQTLQLDVLHVQMPYSPFLAGRIIRAATTEALVGTFHILPANQLVSLGTKLMGWAQAASLSRFHAATATSIPACDYAKHTYGITCQPVPNLVDLKRFSTTPSANTVSDTPTIVFLGRLVERKGCKHLLQAVAVLYKLMPNVRLIVGGTGPLESELRQFVHDNQLEHVVRFEGFVAEQDKPGFLAQADLAVFPATGGESFGIVLIEAMAAGAGVVMGGNNPGYASVLGAWPDVLVEPLQTDQFAQALRALLTDSVRFKQIHTAQQQAVKQYDTAVVGKQILDIYQACLLQP